MREEKPGLAEQFVAASMVNTVLFNLVAKLARNQAFASADGKLAVRIAFDEIATAALVNMTDLRAGDDFDLDTAMRVALESLEDDARNLYAQVFE